MFGGDDEIGTSDSWGAEVMTEVAGDVDAAALEEMHGAVRGRVAPSLRQSGRPDDHIESLTSCVLREQATHHHRARSIVRADGEDPQAPRHVSESGRCWLPCQHSS